MGICEKCRLIYCTKEWSTIEECAMFSPLKEGETKEKLRNWIYEDLPGWEHKETMK